jgi:hypothetical protein
MRPYIPSDIRMRETAELQKSVAADLNVPDPVPASIVTPEPQKSTPKAKKVEDGSAVTSESTAEHDAGTGSVNDNAGVESSGK